ncbi:glycosyltransferase family 4 protein [Mesorhizobium mediterraneum]|uniref:glycosyltransferase family 4 protein n=1 Tax=Mesorhizobium mediterraneum TaxID=43617 RepID=UPI001786A43E|nr:glycosyltransferase family 4 protein [Mesorhizobium mediterraneum]
MRLAIIVTEYPKSTETFILRDVMQFIGAGCEVRLIHLAPSRQHEILHDFAKPTREIARYQPFLAGGAGAAFSGALVAENRRVREIAVAMTRAFVGDPLVLAKSLALIPKSLAIAKDIRQWGACHVHAEFAGHPATAAWIIGRATGIPFSVSCRAHDIFRSQRLLDVKLGEAAFVRTISGFNKNFLVAKLPRLNPDKINIIHSSVDTDRIPLLQPPATDPFRILLVGAMEKKKGVDVLIKALAGLDRRTPWRCDIIGGGNERAALERLRDGLGLRDDVTFHGPMPYESVSAAYKDASVVVAPSIIGPGGRTEGIPNVMIEALAHRRPVIASRVSGVPELVADGVTGLLVEPGSPVDLRRAIERIRAHPDAAYRMALAGRRKVEAEFNLIANARAQLRLFAAHSVGGVRHEEMV